jgi:protein TonB
MIYINKVIKPLLILLLVLALHALVFWQIVQHAPEKPIVQPPKPIMVSLITPPKPPVKAPVLLPVAKKTLVKKTEPKTVVKPKRKLAKRAKKPKKVKRKLAKRAKKPKKIKRKRAKKVKPPRKITKSSRRSKRAIQKKVAATTSKRLAKSTTTASSYQASRSYRVGQNSKKSSRENQARKSSRKKAGGVTTAPSYKAAYLHNPHPPYPRISRRRGEQGKVLLRVKVAKNGRASSVIIKKSSRSRRLDQAARKAVNKWRFIPAKKNGKPVSGWVIVPIVFKLNY